MERRDLLADYKSVPMPPEVRAYVTLL